uniref:Uncharacterized protein n=1 Tax=Panagrolaimus superbus TaxID=310955 RepID=A0A914YTE2_9BILA
MLAVHHDGAPFLVVAHFIDLVGGPLGAAYVVDEHAGGHLLVGPVGIERGTQARVVVIAHHIAVVPAVLGVHVEAVAVGDGGGQADVQVAPLAQREAAARIDVEAVDQGLAAVLVLAHHAGHVAGRVAWQVRGAAHAAGRVGTHCRQLRQVGTITVGDRRARHRDDVFHAAIVRRNDFIVAVDEPVVGRHRQPARRLVDEAEGGDLRLLRLQVLVRLGHARHGAAAVDVQQGLAEIDIARPLRLQQQVGDGIGLVAAQLVTEAAELSEHTAVAGLGQAWCAEARGVRTAQHQLVERLVLEADLRRNVGAEVRVLVHAHRRIQFQLVGDRCHGLGNSA